MFLLAIMMLQASTSPIRNDAEHNPSGQYDACLYSTYSSLRRTNSSQDVLVKRVFHECASKRKVAVKYIARGIASRGAAPTRAAADAEAVVQKGDLALAEAFKSDIRMRKN